MVVIAQLKKCDHSTMSWEGGEWPAKQKGHRPETVVAKSKLLKAVSQGFPQLEIMAASPSC